MALPRLPSRRKLRYLFMGAARSPREAILDLLGYDPTRRLADRRIGKWADAIAWLASVTLVVSVALFREPTSARQARILGPAAAAFGVAVLLALVGAGLGFLAMRVGDPKGRGRRAVLQTGVVLACAALLYVVAGVTDPMARDPREDFIRRPRRR